MNRTLSNVLLFAAGAVVGSAVTWKFVKTKYEQIAQEEIDSVIEVFSRRDDEYESEEDIEVDEEQEEESEGVKYTNTRQKPPLDEYVSQIKKLNYSGESTPEEEEEDVYEPYVISPDEYGEIHAYETIGLNYYADGVLTDELDNPIEDVDSIVGSDYAEHFGEFDEPNIVYIRNDERKCDYEICRDLRRFTDVVGYDLHPSEDE